MTAIYVESSVVLTWLLNQPGADSVRELLLYKEINFVTSVLTFIEAKRALRRNLSGKNPLRQVDVERLLSLVQVAKTEWGLVEITTEIQERAGGEFPIEPVRSLDAIHLATALALLRIHPDLRVMTFDRRIRENAEALGLTLITFK